MGLSSSNKFGATSVSLTLEELRRSVRRTSAKGVELRSGHELVAEAEVGDLDVHLGVEQQVFGLQVAVDDPLLVAVLHRRHDLQVTDWLAHWSRLTRGLELNFNLGYT